MDSGVIIFGIIICVVILIIAISKLVGLSSEQKRSNSQSQEEIQAVKDIDWRKIRSPESRKALQAKLMGRITPRLQCPSSAIMDPGIYITGPNEKGKFNVIGDVDSQNAFGAMKRIRYHATAHYNPTTGEWVVEKVTLIEQ